jgi:hypothetical protein
MVLDQSDRPPPGDLQGFVEDRGLDADPLQRDRGAEAADASAPGGHFHQRHGCSAYEEEALSAVLKEII